MNHQNNRLGPRQWTAALAVALGGLAAVIGCKSEQSLSKSYRDAVRSTVKQVQAVDVDSAGTLADSPAPADLRLIFDPDSPEVNAVLLFRHELDAIDDLLESGEHLPTYGGFHMPFEYFSGTVNAVLGDPNQSSYIPSVEAFERNLIAVTRMKYVGVITETQRTNPRVPRVEELVSGFISGSVEGHVDVFALRDGAWLGGFPFAAASSNEVPSRGSDSLDESISSDFVYNAKRELAAKFEEHFPGTKF